MWAAHGGDLKGEKEMCFSATEPDNKDFCKCFTDQASFERIRSGTDNFNTDWLTAMTDEEQAVDNLTITSDINKNQKGFSDVLARRRDIDLIAHLLLAQK